MRHNYFASLVFAGLFVAARLSALPTLQLDIVGGVYDPATQTTVATSPQFTLRALLSTTSFDPAATYYISAAITPNPGYSDPDPAFGSVKIGSTTYQPSDFLYGKPPADVADTPGSANLASHGIYPTYYLELAFNFDAAQKVAAYNVQDDSSAPGWLYNTDFDIDVSGLTPGFVLHFDLYNEAIKRGVLGVGDFAPFSHDAESAHVPDSGITIALLGLGLLGLGFASRALRTANSPRAVRLKK